MPILAQYVVWEVAKVFSLALSGLTLITTLGMGVREGLREGFPPGVIFQVLPYMLPEILGITLPVAVLFAVTHVFGRMAGANEITALKAAGINPLEVVWPMLGLAAVLSLVTVAMYDLSATWGKPQVQRVGIESIERIAYSVLRQERSFNSKNFSIAVRRVEGRKLVQPTITIYAHGDVPAITVTAREAEIRTDTEAGLVVFRLTDGRIDAGGEVFRFPDTQEQWVPLDANTRPVHRDWLGMREIPEQVARLRAHVERLQARMRAEADPSRRELDRQRLERLEWRIRRLRTEPFRRWANGFTCLCFALIGTPVAMLWRFENLLATFFVCFLPILAVFYPLLMLQEKLTTSGALHPISFWLADVVLVAVGVWLLRRVVQH
ncbi:MAG TPA: YjgP/YjgQ family permease [Planctomycetaceae bacterium]|nr:YjgP/YjgQ family permease [Planctomycetaceae bacterium]